MTAPSHSTRNSPLGRAEQALIAAEHEVEAALEALAGTNQPHLEDQLSETVDALEDQQAALRKAAAADEADAEESGAREAERRAWAPVRPAV